jgi:transposase-like protein
LPARRGPEQRARALAAAERRALIFEYVKAGSSYRDIAHAFGVSHTQIWRDVRRVLDDLQQTTVQDATSYRLLELTRLDQLLQGLWPEAILGNVPAVLAALRISERRARLLGLDAPTRVDIEPALRRLAAAEGLDIEQVLAEAQRLLASGDI